jgi:hypothetical protein
MGKYLNDPDMTSHDLPRKGKRRGILLLFGKICEIISESNIDFQTQHESIGKKSAFYHNASGSVRTLSLRDQKPVGFEDLRDQKADIGVPTERIAQKGLTIVQTSVHPHPRHEEKARHILQIGRSVPPDSMRFHEIPSLLSLALNSTIGISHGQKSNDGVQFSQQSSEMLPIVARRSINTCLPEIPFFPGMDDLPSLVERWEITPSFPSRNGVRYRQIRRSTGGRCVTV